MKQAIDERTVPHTFRFRLTQAETDRLNAYLRETGKKKLAVMQKALVEYLDREGA